MSTFTTIVEAGSFTKAAEQLGLPNARISQRLSDLERHLGVRLLERTTRALNLTDDGRAYYAKCKVILQDIEELEGTLSHAVHKPKGRLRVEALMSVARWVLAPHLHEFKALYPDVIVRLGSNDRIRNMLEEGIDVAIRGGNLDDSSQIARKACEVRFGLYAAPDYLEEVVSPEHPRELSRHRLLSWFGGPRNPFHWQLHSEQESVEVQGRQGIQFDDPDAAMASCMAGGGVCPGAPFAVQAWVKEGRLLPVLEQWSFHPRPIHIIYPKSRHLSARVRCFVDWSIELLQHTESVSLHPWQLAQDMRNVT